MGKKIVRKKRKNSISKLPLLKPREEIKKLDIIESSELESSEEENYNLNLGYDKDDKNILATLVKRCKKTKQEIIEEHQKFMKRCPRGELSKDDFLFECEDLLIGRAVFKVFDVDESGTMDFAEYVQATHALTLNSVDDKLEWIFCLFDSDGGGTVDMDEIEEIVKSIIDFAGMKRDEKVIDACVLDVKRTLDRDHDGAITKEEFMVHARRSKFIKNMFLKG